MYRVLFKNIFDIFLAFLLIIFLLPLIVILSLLIYLKMGSPILFRQIRPGYDEKLFTIYKFRTMSDDRDANGNLLPDESRLKGLGKWIRKFSLDELPQLFNVLKGDMSFVGPRPLLPEYLPLYNQKQKRRHEVKPGITGWAQVNGRNAISWKEKFDLDVWYVDNQSFLLDLKIFWMTLSKVLKSDGVFQKGNVTMEKFRGSENV